MFNSISRRVLQQLNDSNFGMTIIILFSVICSRQNWLSKKEDLVTRTTVIFNASY